LFLATLKLTIFVASTTTSQAIMNFSFSVSHNLKPFGSYPTNMVLNNISSNLRFLILLCTNTV